MTKDFESFASQLRALADEMAAQRPRPAFVEVQEELVQFTLRRSLRRQLDQLAEEADMTMKAFTLAALRDKGLDVQPEDLADLRRKR
jgi:hypothetical protein